MTSGNFFFNVAIDSLGRAVPGGDDSVRGMGNNRFVNRVGDRLQPGNRLFSALAFSQICNSDDRADNLLAHNQRRVRGFNR